MDVISAKLDIIFKKLFLSDLDVLTDFIGALLDIPKGGIQNLEVLNPELLPAYYEGKQGQLDIKMMVDEKIVNVELQMQNKGDYKDRTLFYWSKLYSDELKKGDPYTPAKAPSTATAPTTHGGGGAENLTTAGRRECPASRTTTDAPACCEWPRTEWT